MIFHTSERVYWGAPEVIYLEGTISKLDEDTQSVVVHIDRAHHIPHTSLAQRLSFLLMDSSHCRVIVLQALPLSALYSRSHRAQ